MNRNLRIQLLVTSLGLIGAVGLACSSSSGSPAGDAPVPFTIPTGWAFGNTCTGSVDIAYHEPSCSTTYWVLCESGAWTEAVCSQDEPAGFHADPDEEGDASTEAGASYPACGETTCPSCLDLQVCCTGGGLPNAGVCDHTGWDESVCESLLNKYSASCGEVCDAGKCTSTSGDSGSEAGAADSGSSDAASGG